MQRPQSMSRPCSGLLCSNLLFNLTHFMIFLPVILTSSFQTVPSSQYYHRAHPPSQHALYAVQSQRPLLSGSVQTGKGKSFIPSHPSFFYYFLLNLDFRGHDEKTVKKQQVLHIMKAILHVVFSVVLHSFNQFVFFVITTVKFCIFDYFLVFFVLFPSLPLV